MTEDVWPLAQTILEKIAEWEADDHPSRDIIKLAEQLGEDAKRVQRQVQALYNDEYLAGARSDKWQFGFDLMAMHLLPKGMRQIGEWPSEDAYGELLKILDAKLADETDPEQKGKLQKLRDGVLAAGREVAVGVITEALKRGTLGA